MKAALVDAEKKEVLASSTRYFPIWIRGWKLLPRVLISLLQPLIEQAEAIAVTTTAELSDIFFSKREGVARILDSAEAVLWRRQFNVLTVRGELISPEEARKVPYEVAAANWYASGYFASRFLSDCIVIDVGSTTTSIVPVSGGKVAARGRDDLEKLACGELVYTGALRTNLATIVDSVPLRGRSVRVSAEKFALSGDVHLILGNISHWDYTTETADGRGTARRECMARIARLVCADLGMLHEKEILEIARFINDAQVRQIAEGLRQVLDGLAKDVPALVAGIGKEFLAKPAALRAGLSKVVDADSFIPNSSKALPAAGLALMAAEVDV